MIMAFLGTWWTLKNSSLDWNNQSCYNLPEQPGCQNAVYLWYQNPKQQTAVPTQFVNMIPSYVYTWFTTFGTWILIQTNLVPISLLVTFEVVKFWQALMMTYDIKMYDEE
jgi:hypothetical protein